MYRQITLALVATLAVGCSTSPDRANDPRGGGFFGGLVGVTRGDYTARKQEREDALSSIHQANQGVAQDNLTLEQTRQTQQEEVGQLKRQVTKLNSNVRSLSVQVANLQQRSGSAEAAQLQRRVGTLDRKSAALKGKAVGGDTAALTRQKAQLEQEYAASLQTYMALSDAGGTGESKPASTGLRDMPK
ncbi:hypothetical protein [uncultured Lamprocystis sp.]|jgi:chromosome segregation ATPase|uniref:hypothetical protein n=1 Tax=uncultured Lamprocystis sp. TaxID=543132 RepID=UPI0025ED278F|nr:hypothetical protein [uncultured Lamprocystis sp.]